MENKILFLGDKESPLLEWLLSIGEFVIQTSEKITPKFDDYVSFVLMNFLNRSFFLSRRGSIMIYSLNNRGYID